MKRFSKNQLFRLRNSIHINRLIKEILQIPSTISQGQLRFLCPVCSQFNTATKPKTNLARCFDCERNFNTIEMVMETKHLNFIESVNFLQNLLSANESKEMTTNKAPAQYSTSLKIPKEPVSMRTLVKNMNIGKSRKLNEISKRVPAHSHQQAPVIGQLNDKLDRLSKQMDQLKSFVIDQFIEKSKKQTVKANMNKT
jgi:hypothetical protein